MVIIFKMGKKVVLLMAIQLTFMFSHSRYERLCQKRDEWVKNHCQEMVKKRNKNEGVNVNNDGTSGCWERCRRKWYRLRGNNQDLEQSLLRL